MKKIKFFVIILLSSIMISCADSYDKEKCLESIKKVYPNSIVYSYNSDFTFFVLDTITNDIYYVETLSLKNSKITKSEKLKISDNK